MILHNNRLPADNSHAISGLICYFWKSDKICNCSLLQIKGGAWRVKNDLSYDFCGSCLIKGNNGIPSQWLINLLWIQLFILIRVCRVCIKNCTHYYSWTHCMLANFHTFVEICCLFFNLINFYKKKSFRNTIRVSNCIDSDHNVSSDLGPNS